MIIAFGEAVLTTGTALSSAPYAPMTLHSAGVVLTGTIALFWLLFSRSQRMVHHYQHTEDPIRAGRSGVYSLMISVAGMIAAAAGDERVIGHPTYRAGVTTDLLLFAGPALFIAAQTWFGAVLLGDLRRPRVIVLCVLALGCAVTIDTPAYVGAMTAAGTCWH